MKQLLTVVMITAFAVVSCKKSQIPETTGSENTIRRSVNPVPLGALGSTEQEFSEKIMGTTESFNRLQLGNPWSDFDPTGFYLPPGVAMTLTVQQLSGTALPKLLIGTYSRDTLRWDPRSVQLTAGSNTISSDTYGGLIWIRYTTSGTPAGKVKITFNSGAVRAPLFIKDQTTDWESQVAAYTTSPDVLLVNNSTYLVTGRSRAGATSNADANNILQTIDRAVEFGEDYISGFDNSAPEHMKPTHKIAMVESPARNLWGAASYYRTWFAPGLWNDCLTYPSMVNNGWGSWHELGHMRQQQPWKWSTLGEVTVNIYSLAAERAISGGGVNRLKGTTTTNALNYIANTNTDKDFNSNTYMSDGNFIRLFMFHQLWLAFGDAFYINLHKQTRVEKPVVTNDEQKMRYFMLKACTISGRNLTTFFRKWGFKVNESVYTEIAALNLPAPVTEPSTLTDDNAGLIENGATYKIVSAVNNSSILDLSGGGVPANGTVVALWTANNPLSNNQKWLLRSLGNGEFALKTLADTAKVMDVRSGASANGTQIQVYSYANAAAQRWTPAYVGDGYYNLSPACATDKNLDVNGGFSTNGTKIQIWTKNTGNAQKFKLVKL
ncbi:M60 family metallopeptidase [Niabella sp. 22666]|uniref:M60 family metallopeptidase n=1 Tax=Niabella sp. 22666 TaxID=3453954 RepID=UPI003F84B30F